MSTISKRLGDIRRSIGIWTTPEVVHLAKVLEEEQKRGQRASVLGYGEFVFFEDKLVAQPWNYLMLKTYALYHPFLNIVHSAIIREVVKRQLVPVANFAHKCTKCGHEYMRPMDKCECGSTSFREPRYSEKVRIQAFIKDPNRQNEMKQIVETVLRDCLATGNAYISKSLVAGREYEVWNEPVEYMWIGTDERAVLGNGVYFCPKCHDSGDDTNTTYSAQDATKRDKTCPKCSGTLQETSYFFRKDNYIARFTKNEIIHFNANPWLPFPYGWSQVIACLLELRSATAMSQFNFDNYSLARMAKIIVHKGANQTEANAIATAIKSQETTINEKRVSEGYVTKIQRTLHLGSRLGVEVHDALPDPQKMQSLEWFDFWLTKIIAPIYGVQPIYMNVGGSGSGGSMQRMQIVVNNDAVTKWRDLISGCLTENLIPDMGIKDWHFDFEPIEPVDRRADAQVMKEQLAVLQMAALLGVPAKIDDEGVLFMSGEVDMEHYKEMMQATNPFQNPPGVGGTKPGETTHVDNLPPKDSEPRQPGDESITPGADQGKR